MSTLSNQQTISIFVELKNNFSKTFSELNNSFQLFDKNLNSVEKTGVETFQTLVESSTEFGNSIDNLFIQDYSTFWLSLLREVQIAFERFTKFVQNENKIIKSSTKDLTQTIQEDWKKALETIKAVYKLFINKEISDLYASFVSSLTQYVHLSIQKTGDLTKKQLEALSKAKKQLLVSFISSGAALLGQHLAKGTGSKLPAYLGMAGTFVGGIFGGALGAQLGSGLGTLLGGLFAMGSDPYEKFKNAGMEMGFVFSKAFADTIKTEFEKLEKFYSDHAAMIIAIVRNIPAMLARQGAATQGQFDALLWKISHCIEEMIKAGDGARAAFAEVLPAMLALSKQISDGSIQITHHFKSIISGLFQTGMVSADLWSKIKDKIKEADIRAWLSELAIGFRKNTLMAGEFFAQFKLLLAEALKRGIDATGTAKRGTVPPAKNNLRRHGGLSPFCGRIVQPATVGLASCRTNIVGADLPVAA